MGADGLSAHTFLNPNIAQFVAFGAGFSIFLPLCGALGAAAAGMAAGYLEGGAACVTLPERTTRRHQKD